MASAGDCDVKNNYLNATVLNLRPSLARSMHCSIYLMSALYINSSNYVVFLLHFAFLCCVAVRTLYLSWLTPES